MTFEPTPAEQAAFVDTCWNYATYQVRYVAEYFPEETLADWRDRAAAFCNSEIAMFKAIIKTAERKRATKLQKFNAIWAQEGLEKTSYALGFIDDVTI